MTKTECAAIYKAARLVLISSVPTSWGRNGEVVVPIHLMQRLSRVLLRRPLPRDSRALRAIARGPR